MMTRPSRQAIVGVVLLICFLFTSIPQTASANGDNTLITLECKKIPLEDTIFALAKLADKPILVSGDIKGTVTMQFTQWPFTRILSYLADAFSFNWAERDGAIIVSPSNNLNSIRSFQVKHLPMDTVLQQMSLLVDAGKVIIDKPASVLTVNAGEAVFNRIEQFLAENDKPVPQIVIEVKMVERTVDDNLKAGFNHTWNSFDSSAKDWKFTTISSLDLDRQKGNARILSEPTITTFSGHEANVELVEEVPIFTTKTDYNGYRDTTVEYKNVGVKMLVTPRVNDMETGVVSMVVKPTVSSISRIVKTKETEAPQVSTRTAATIARVASGETLVLAGLVKKDDIENLTQIPGLSKLPLFGSLFKHRSSQKVTTEVMIYVTPRIIGFEKKTDEPLPDANPPSEINAIEEVSDIQEAYPLPEKRVPATPAQPVVRITEVVPHIEGDAQTAETEERSQGIRIVEQPQSAATSNKQSSIQQTPVTSNVRILSPEETAANQPNLPNNARANANKALLVAAQPVPTAILRQFQKEPDSQKTYLTLLSVFANKQAGLSADNTTGDTQSHMESVIQLVATLNTKLAPERLALREVFSGQNDELARYQLANWLIDNQFDKKRVSAIFMQLEKRDIPIKKALQALDNFPTGLSFVETEKEVLQRLARTEHED